jgi:hypothetical protein
MYKESESMRKLHEIREQMHKETKHMTIEEKIAYINKAANRVKKKYGLKFKKVSRVKQHH